MDSFRKMSRLMALFLPMIIIFIIPATSQPQPHPQPQTCESYKFPDGKKFAACNDLPFLGSSIHWTYHSSTNSIDVAFKKNDVNRASWIAWALNPTSTGMLGSQAFVALQKSDGTVVAYTAPLTSYGTTLEQGSLSFKVNGVSASFEDGTMILYTNFHLPRSSTLVNHVWQEGLVSDDGQLRSHALSGDNLKSFGQIDFVAGKVYHQNHVHNSKIIIRKVHGILNGIAWGIMMPAGVIMGRYLKTCESIGPTWFHLHRACQILAYIIGSIGFSLGFFLSNSSSLSSLSPSTHVHASIGIALFVSATVQVLAAIFLRPDKHHKYRIFWNIFHYILGYGIIVLSIFNVFKGFSISNSYLTWRNAYFGVIVSLGCLALVLEVVTWCKRLNNKKIVNEGEIPNEDNIPDSRHDIIDRVV